MGENLNHWTFVIASYAITMIGTAVLIGSSLLAMRRAEARKDRSRDQ
jgi:nitrate reductase gamma subunit